MQPPLGHEAARTAAPLRLAVEGLGADLPLAGRAVLLEARGEGQGGPRRPREAEGGGVHQTGEIGLLHSRPAVRELGHVLQRAAVGSELDRAAHGDPLGGAFEGHGRRLQRQAQGGVCQFGVLDGALVGRLEIAGALFQIAAEREDDVRLAAQPGRVQAVPPRHPGARLVDHLEDPPRVALGLAVDIDALALAREARDLHQTLGQPDAFDGSRLHLHVVGVAVEPAAPARRMDHRQAFVGQDVGAFEAEGQAHLVVPYRPSRG